MNALGATVPVSAGFLEICKYSDLNALNKVGGLFGIGIAIASVGGAAELGGTTPLGEHEEGEEG